MSSRTYYTKPSITELEIRHAFAAAKGNTLFNYAGIKPDLLPYVCDAAPSKQGRFPPGSHLPIPPSAALREDKPDYVLILPWNIKEEIVEQLSYIRD